MHQPLVKVTFTKDVPGLGDKIRQFREQSSMSQTALAAAAGISVPHWNRIENERVGSIPIETIRGIERASGVDLGVEFGS
jgi:transcriptional regulator with XRE-family HTH domain